MSFLDSDLLARIHEHAADTDAVNTYPEKGLEELREARYLSTFVLIELGGVGLNLAKIAVEQTALAKAALGTALDINMHQTIVDLNRYLVVNGNVCGGQILRDAITGEIFGFSIFGPSGGLILFDSTTYMTATADGGYSSEGTRIFASLSPMWTRLLVSGRVETEEGPKSAFGIIRCDNKGYSIKDDWSTLGMCTTQSVTTLLEGVTVPKERIPTATDPGPNVDPATFGTFSHFKILPTATYRGVGKRTAEMAARHVAMRRSVKSQTTYPNSPDVRWRIAEAALIMNVVGPQVRKLACDVDEGVDHDRSWVPWLLATKNAATEAALHAIEQATRVCGGNAYYSTHKLPRLYRGALVGLFQPSDRKSLHAT